MIKMKTDTKTKKVLFGGEAKKMCNDACKSALKEIGELVTKELKEGIKNPPKTGRYYSYHGMKVRASVNRTLEEYPANRSGRLKMSIDYVITNARKMIARINAPYAEYLEEGTAIMAKRKLLGFTIKENGNKIKDILRQNINSEFK